MSLRAAPPAHDARVWADDTRVLCPHAYAAHDAAVHHGLLQLATDLKSRVTVLWRERMARGVR